MDLWFQEIRNGNTGLSLKVVKTIFQGQSPFQKMDIVETEALGRMMLLDGMVMLTDADEFIYHEMISHVPLNVHPHPRQVLVIGGGDGGTIREIVKHPEITSAELVEIDQLVVDKSREFFPAIACELGNPKVSLHYEDGIAYVKNQKNKYDLIIVDSTDPIGPAVGLFSLEFYVSCYNALKEDGIMTAQSESPFTDKATIRSIHNNLRKVFPITELYLAPIPTYPSGYWSFSFASKKYEPKNVIMDKARSISQQTKYYNPEVHTASFCLPNFVREILA